VEHQSSSVAAWAEDQPAAVTSRAAKSTVLSTKTPGQPTAVSTDEASESAHFTASGEPTDPAEAG
jgi:hypothetical protein